MKRLLLFPIVFLVMLSVQAQQIVAEIGRTTARFDYTDSEGGELDNLFSKSNISFLAGYRMPVYKRIHVLAAAQFNQYNVYGSDEIYDNSFSWDVQYLGLSLGIEGDVWKYKQFSLLLRATAEPQFLISGTQTVNGQVNSLKGVEEFDRPFLFARGGIGVNYCLEDRIAVTMRYSYGKGWPLGKTESDEKLSILSSTISIGLLISVNHCDYCYTNQFMIKKSKSRKL